MKNLKLLLIASSLAGFASFASFANGAVVSVNIAANDPDNFLASTDVAGVFAVDNWNNKISNGGGAVQVTDDSGTLLATTVSTSSQYSGPALSTDATRPANDIMMGTGTDSSGGDMTATITGITFELYDVYVYFGSRGSLDRFGDYTITPSGTGATAPQTLRGYDIGTFATVGGFLLEDGSGSGSGVGNYMHFKNVSGANLTILASPENAGVSRAPLNGFQLVQVPEPSTLALIGFSGLALFIRRRR